MSVYPVSVDMTEDSFKEFIDRFGPVDRSSVIRDDTGKVVQGLAVFKTAEDAKKCLDYKSAIHIIKPYVNKDNREKRQDLFTDTDL